MATSRATNRSTLLTFFIMVALMCASIIGQSTTNIEQPSAATNSTTTTPSYTTQDIQTLLNGKKQHLQQVQSALIETNILSDACEMFGKSSPLYATYSSGKSLMRNELLEVKMSLEYEIDNIQKMQKDLKSMDETNSKLIAEKKAKEEAEAKLLAEKQAAAEKKKAKEEEKKLNEFYGDLPSSTILTSSQSSRFVNEILKDVKKNNPMKLLYKATRDGFASSSFHSKCDEKGASVTIIKTKEGAIFGGYSNIGWKSGVSRSWYYDPSAFLFFSIKGRKI